MENIFEKEIDGTVYRLAEPDVVPARILQLRIGKTLGAPFVAMIGNSIEVNKEVPEEEEFIPVSAFSSALMTINPTESVSLIKDLCELTINGTKGRKTNYSIDFKAGTATDLKVAVWVVESIFANFIKDLLESKIEETIVSMIPKSEEFKEQPQT